MLGQTACICVFVCLCLKDFSVDLLDRNGEERGEQLCEDKPEKRRLELMMNDETSKEKLRGKDDGSLIL